MYMAVGGFKILAGIGVAVALAGFLARPVFPDNASNHGLKTAVGLGIKLIGVVSAVGGFLGFSSVNITRSMLGAAALFEKKSETVKRFTTTMNGVEVIVFQPVGESDGLRPGILHYHGGGWMLMSPEAYARYCEEVVEQTGSVLVSVNYRLAPEYLYPIPLEDCLTATRYFLKNARNYGVDEDRIGVKGDSAGGNLAMAVALKLSKEKSLPSLKFMSLDYPALQAFDFNLPCYQRYDNGPGMLTKKGMISYWLVYAFGNTQYYDLLQDNKHLTNKLRDSIYSEYVDQDFLPENIRNSVTTTEEKTKTSNDKVPEELTEIITDPLFAPLMASDKDLSYLPPTYMFNVEFDVLRDDGLIAAERLERAGVKVTRRFLPTEEHGYLNFVSADTSVQQEIIRFAAFFNETLKI